MPQQSVPKTNRRECKTTNTSVRIETGLYEEIALFAEREHRTISNVLRMLVHEAWLARKERNPE